MRLRSTWLARALGLGGWAITVTVLLAADDSDPLVSGRLGAAAALLGLIGLGALGRFARVGLGALVLVVLAFLVRPREEDYDTVLLLIGAVPASLVLAAVVAAVGALARRRAPGRVVDRVGAGALAAALVCCAIGVVLDARVVDRRPKAPLTFDGRTGAYRGLRAGGPAGDLRRFSRVRVESSDTGRFEPLDASGRLTSPTAYTSDFDLHRFADATVFVRRGVVTGYLTTSPRAQLPSGVGVGDSIDLVSRRERSFNCGGVSYGSDTSRPVNTVCTRSLADGRTLWVGGDPIDSIWVVPPLGG